MHKDAYPKIKLTTSCNNAITSRTRYRGGGEASDLRWCDFPVTKHGTMEGDRLIDVIVVGAGLSGRYGYIFILCYMKSHARNKE